MQNILTDIMYYVTLDMEVPIKFRELSGSRDISRGGLGTRAPPGRIKNYVRNL